MLFSEPTLKELISSYLDLLHNSKKFLRDENQIDIILRLKDAKNDQPIEVRNEQLKLAEELLVGEGWASFEVIYKGTHFKAYHAFNILNHRYTPKYFQGLVGTDKVEKDEFVNRLEKELRKTLRPYVNCVIFPGLFV